MSAKHISFQTHPQFILFLLYSSWLIHSISLEFFKEIGSVWETWNISYLIRTGMKGKSAVSSTWTKWDFNSSVGMRPVFQDYILLDQHEEAGDRGDSGALVWGMGHPLHICFYQQATTINCSAHQKGQLFWDAYLQLLVQRIVLPFPLH